MLTIGVMPTPAEMRTMLSASFPSNVNFPTGPARFDQVAHLEQINDVTGDRAAWLTLHGQIDVFALRRGG